jgi:hypothetical protein
MNMRAHPDEENSSNTNESLINDSPLNNENSKLPDESLIDDSPLNENSEDSEANDGGQILPSPD